MVCSVVIVEETPVVDITVVETKETPEIAPEVVVVIETDDAEVVREMEVDDKVEELEEMEEDEMSEDKDDVGAKLEAVSTSNYV